MKLLFLIDIIELSVTEFSVGPLICSIMYLIFLYDLMNSLKAKIYERSLQLVDCKV